MNKLLLAAIFAFSFFTFYGQNRIPVLSDKEDSVLYFRVSEQIRQSGPVDSLLNLQKGILQRSLVRWYYQYTPSTNFTPYEDLQDGKADPSGIRKLSISDFNGEQLPDDLLLCRNLDELELVNTSVSVIQKQLNKLKNLRGIYIYNNHPAERLKLERNRHVNFMRISGDPGKLPSDFKKFKALDSLDLKRNSLTVFPNLSKNKRLKALSLSENMLTLENLSLKKNKRLEHLFLRENKITTVPAELSKFTRLKGIVFNNNRVTDIEPGFAALKYLEQISFYRNQLTSIPETIYQLVNLKELDLYYNRINAVDSGICQLKNLQVLYLSHNRVFTLPACMGELQQLSALFLHHNLLTSLPDGMSRLEGLKTLRINNNIFSTLPPVTLELHNLETLDISYNQLTKLPPELSHLTKLKLFALADNPWTDREEIVSIAGKMREKGTQVHITTLRNIDDK